MTMTRKHFEMIAACNRAAFTLASSNDSSLQVLLYVIGEQSIAFAAEHPHFDADRFLTASLPAQEIAQ